MRQKRVLKLVRIRTKSSACDYAIVRGCVEGGRPPLRCPTMLSLIVWTQLAVNMQTERNNYIVFSGNAVRQSQHNDGQLLVILCRILQPAGLICPEQTPLFGSTGGSRNEGW